MAIETDNVLSVLVHSDSKEGKSTLSSTAPLPGLVLDAEGSWKFIDQIGYRSGKPLRVKLWKPNQEPIPRYDGTWDFCRVHVDTWPTMELVYKHLLTGQHDFSSIVVDSITELQRRCKKQVMPPGSGQMEQRHWGQLLDRMDQVIRDLRDLTLLPNTVRFVLFNAETAMHDGKWRPFMQGGIRTTLPYWVDICGYLFTEMVATGGQQAKVKKLLIGAGVSPAHIVGERVQGRLPDIIDNPHFTNIMSTVFPNQNNTTGA